MILFINSRADVISDLNLFLVLVVECAHYFLMVIA